MTDTPRFKVQRVRRGQPVSSWTLTIPTTKQLIVGFPTVEAARAFATEWWPDKGGFLIQPAATREQIVSLLAECLRHEDNGFL